MGKTNDIKNAFRKLLEKNGEEYCVVCKVDSVSESDLTAYCIPLDEQKADIPNVRLITDTSKQGFIIFPKVGSYVMVSFISNEMGYISMFSEVDKIYLNGSNYSGLVKIDDLVTKLNNLENAFNQHILSYNAHTHAGVTVGSGVTGITTPDTQNLQTTKKSDLENTTVKHGSGS